MQLWRTRLEKGFRVGTSLVRFVLWVKGRTNMSWFSVWFWACVAYTGREQPCVVVRGCRLDWQTAQRTICSLVRQLVSVCTRFRLCLVDFLPPSCPGPLAGMLTAAFAAVPTIITTQVDICIHLPAFSRRISCIFFSWLLFQKNSSDFLQVWWPASFLARPLLTAEGWGSLYVALDSFLLSIVLLKIDRSGCGCLVAQWFHVKSYMT